MYRKLTFIIIFLSVLFLSCSGPNENSLEDVETWTFTWQSGYISGSQTQFDSYLWQFLSESQWNNIKSYAVERDTFANVSWDTVVSWLNNWDFPENVIREFKNKLASNERATHFYRNSDDEYFWVRLLKE